MQLNCKSNEYFIREALKEAQKAYNEDEVPVGAIAVYRNKIIARAHNQIVKLNDPTAHAEILALRKASKKLQNERLNGVCLYVTLEPCLMCVGAMILARIEYLVYSAEDKKTGAVNLLKTIKSNHNFKIINGILAENSADLLKRFFKTKRN
ncbi:MAG: tRNA adenosine(34) deaminase TadA [Candidatus Firestonebacteria bacterium]